MNDKQNMPKMKLKLSLKKETLRPLSDCELDLLNGVVGGTGGGGCEMTCLRTQIGTIVE
jgi:hypothetical protein